MANWEFQWGGENKLGYIGLMTAGETLGMGINDLAAKPDYTVGTWTPSYKPATGDDFESATYDIQEGFYIKVNAFYFCTFAMRTDAIDKGTATLGAAVTVIGLPGVASAKTYIGSFGMTMSFTINNPTNGIIDNTSQVISLYYGNSSSALTVVNLRTVANSNFLAGQFLYKSS